MGMGFEQCGILVPRIDAGMCIESENKCSSECLLPDNHHGEHIFKNERGEYIIWENDSFCECCDIQDPDRCFNFDILERDEAVALLNASIEGL